MCSSFNFSPYYLTVVLRGAGLIANTLQDLTMVGEGEGGVGSLGNSWMIYDRKDSLVTVTQTR